MIELLVTYDVSTETKEGRRRLRKVATICLGHGQRVQQSVFECRVTEAQFESLTARLVAMIDLDQDSIRIYRLPSDRDRNVQIFGARPVHDLREPLIV